MKYGHGRRPALRRIAQIERVVPRPGDQPADQQEVPRAGGGGQRPVAEARSLGAGAAGAALEHRILHRLVRADHGPGWQGDEEVAREDAHVRQACLLARLAQLAAAGIHLIERGPATGSPAAASRLSWAAARSGLVVIARSSGIPAARRRRGPWPTGPACTHRSPPTHARTW